jgi:hypothetical protein
MCVEEQHQLPAMPHAQLQLQLGWPVQHAHDVSAIVELCAGYILLAEGLATGLCLDIEALCKGHTRQDNGFQVHLIHPAATHLP